MDKQIIAALVNVLLGLGQSVIVTLLRQKEGFWTKVPAKLKPYISTALGIISGLLAHNATGADPATAAVFAGGGGALGKLAHDLEKAKRDDA